MQESSTNQIVHSIEECIAWVSKICTLKPGDLMLTGTPPGVGVFRKPPVCLKVSYPIALLFLRRLMIFIGGRNLVSMLCIVTLPVGLLFFFVPIYIAQMENLNNQVTLEYGPGLNSYLANFTST